MFLRFCVSVRLDWPEVRSFIRLSITKLVNKIFCKRMNRLMQISTTGLWDQLWRSDIQRSRSHEAEIGHKNPFRWDISRPSDEFWPNLASTYHGKCPLSHNNPDAKGQRSWSYEADVIYWGLAEASFLTPLGWVAFRVSRSYTFVSVRLTVVG